LEAAAADLRGETGAHMTIQDLAMRRARRKKPSELGLRTQGAIIRLGEGACRTCVFCRS